MSLTKSLYEADGATTDFTFAFPYLSPTHIRVTVNGTVTTRGLDYELVGASLIRFFSPPVEGAAVEIRRVTDRTARLVDFENGSVLTEEALDLAHQQTFFISQEIIEEYEGLLTAGLTRFASEFGVFQGSAQEILEAISADVLESQLYLDLQSGLGDLDTVSAGLAQEIIDRVTAITAEAAARTSDVASLQSQISTLASDLAASTYVQPEEPVPGVDGVPDPILNGARWFDSDDGNRPYLRVNDVWTDVSDARFASIDADVQALGSRVTSTETSITANAGAISALETVTTDINGTISTLSSDLTSLTTRVSDAEGNITGANSAISALTTRVDTVEGDVAAAQALDLTQLRSQVYGASFIQFDDGEPLEFDDGSALALSSVDLVALAQDALTTRVSTTEGELTVQSSRITSLEASASTQDGSISANAAAVSALDTRVTTTESSISSQAGDITSLQSDASGLRADVDANASAVSSLDTRVSAAEGSISSQSTSITTLQSATTSLQGDLAQEQADRLAGDSAQASATSALDTRVSAAEGTISSQATSLTSLQADAASLRDDLTQEQADRLAGDNAQATATSALDVRVSANETELATVAQRTTILEVAQNVSGANLLPLAAVTLDQQSEFVPLRAGGEPYAPEVVILDVALADLDTNIDLEGESLSLSVAAFEPIHDRLRLVMRWYDDQGAELQEDVSNSADVSFFTRIRENGTVPAGAVTLRGFLRSIDGGVIANWRELMLNLGSFAAPFELPLEGSALVQTIEAATVENASGVVTNAAAITSLTSQLSDVESGQAGQSTAISTLQTDVSNLDGEISSTASALTALTSTVNGQSTTIAQQASTLNGLEAQYTVKIDNNGHVSGFGLASTPGLDGSPFSSFIINADRFAVVRPGGSTVPFVVQNGQVFIQSAVIPNLSADKITTGTLNANRIAIDTAILDTNASGQLTVNGIPWNRVSNAGGGRPEDGATYGIPGNPLIAYTAGSVQQPATGWKVAQSVTTSVPITGKYLVRLTLYYKRYDDGGTGSCFFRFLLNGVENGALSTQSFACANDGRLNCFTFEALVDLNAGSNSFSLDFHNQFGLTECRNRTITILPLR